MNPQFAEPTGARPDHVRATFSPWHRSITVLLRTRDYLAKPPEMVRCDPAVTITQPTFELSHEAAQVLMDDLWACGLRPTEGAGIAGALAATARHLDDMRRLVFEGKEKKP